MGYYQLTEPHGESTICRKLKTRGKLPRDEGDPGQRTYVAQKEKSSSLVPEPQANTSNQTLVTQCMSQAFGGLNIG